MSNYKSEEFNKYLLNYIHFLSNHGDIYIEKSLDPYSWNGDKNNLYENKINLQQSLSSEIVQHISKTLFWFEDLDEMYNILNYYYFSCKIDNYYLSSLINLQLSNYTLPARMYFFEEFKHSRKMIPFMPFFLDEYANALGLCFDENRRCARVCYKTFDCNP